VNLLTILGLCSFALVAGFTWRAALGAHRSGQGQSARESIIEAWLNVCIGFTVNWLANFALLPLVNASFTAWENFMLGWIYTAVSVVRQFALRRAFNSARFASWLAAKVGR
jgi:hypothetical protein